MAARGIRYLLAVRGGIEVPAVLGSRSRDTLAALGPEPVVAGRVLAIGAEPAASVPIVDQDVAFPPPAGAVTLALLPGPRADWFTDAARDALFESRWRLSEHADRIGARLVGPALERRRAGELASEATVPGSMQVAGDGLPDDPARRPPGDRRLPGDRDRRAGVARRGGAAAARPGGALPARVRSLPPARGRAPPCRDKRGSNSSHVRGIVEVSSKRTDLGGSTMPLDDAHHPTQPAPRPTRLPHPRGRRCRRIRLHRDRRHARARRRVRRRAGRPRCRRRSRRASASCARCGSRRS